MENSAFSATPPRSLRSPWVWLFAGLVVFALAAADLLLHGPLTAADPAISTWLHQHMQAALTRLLFGFTHMHSTLGLSLMSAMLALVFIALREPWWIARMLATVQGGQLLNAGLKEVFQRTRPHWDEPLVSLSTGSFPSGHAAGTTVFWGFVCVAAFSLGAPPAARRALAVLAPLMVVLTCFSRVYLGAHYFSDVLAGVGEGVAWVALWAFVIRARTMRA